MSTAQQAKGIDVDFIDVPILKEPTFDVVFLQDEDGNPVSGFRIVGKNSPQYQEIDNSLRIEGIMKSSKRSTQLDTSNEDGAGILAKTIKGNERAIALAVTTDWFGFNSEGAARQFDRNIVEKLLVKYPTWVTKINAALDKDKNFMTV